ncbi:MAG TPA: L,D-transpeptidase [Gaiellaceae bacterium]|nr:L,D-transpeptidase [Gaiellaceae bacterium]
MTKTLRQTAIGLATLAALTAVVAAGAGTTRAHGPELSVRWQAPTPRDGTAYGVKVGEPLTFELAAASGSVIRSRRLPAGVSFGASPGQAKVQWTPTANQVGEHVLTFAAQNGNRFARPRSFLVYVLPATPAGAHDEFQLGGVDGMSRYAEVYTDVSARSRPSSRAKALIRLHGYTPEGTPNLVQTLSGVINQNDEYWIRVRLPMLPNGRTGWVPSTTLGPYKRIWTHLVIDRKLFTATLYRRGRAIFTTRVGVGKPFWPTPAGDFYVRERITGFSDQIYGPIAFGTNARSNVLTDWPGGGFIGIHGTSQPEILPGRVSHGCVRMPNPAIRRLARLMPLGTPVTIF